MLVDFDKRTEDKTNSNVLILGNSGQGKSHLLKLLLCNHREAGKSVLVLDPESEYQELCANLGGTYIDMMSGEYMINSLEPKHGATSVTLDPFRVRRKTLTEKKLPATIMNLYPNYSDRLHA